MALIALKTAEPMTAVWGRLLVASAGVSSVAVAIYVAPSWIETKSLSVVVATVASTGLLALGACVFAVRASAQAVERAAVEIGCLAVAVGLTEAVLVGLAPESWSDIHQVQRMIAQQRAATAQGNVYDARLRSDVIRDLKSVGRAAIPGTAPTLLLHPSALAAASKQGLLPLANASNAFVVECNEGTGYLTYRTDELGFNNPPGLASGPIRIAVIGESLALGHCVPPTKSAVDLVRARYPRTANFGVAGARVLSQLGIFREYVEPLRPPVVLWFLNTNFAESNEEADLAVLASYLDPAFSQGLRDRQNEVDSFVRDVLVPLNLRQDEVLRADIEGSSRFPIERVLKLRTLRSSLGAALGTDQRPPPADLAHFERALHLVGSATRSWGGQLVVVILPSYAMTIEQAYTVVRYDAVQRALDVANATVVDGVALYRTQPDPLDLFALRQDGHPNERGHALLADAVITAVEELGVL